MHLTSHYFGSEGAISALQNYQYSAGEYSTLDNLMNKFWFKLESCIPEVPPHIDYSRQWPPTF